jgi:hypothetical protein
MAYSLLQHPIHKSYFLDKQDNFYHKVGSELVPLKLVKGNISIAVGDDERKRYSPSVFRNEIQSIKQKVRNAAATTNKKA